MGMAAIAEQTLVPNRQAMLAQLEHLFGGYLDGAQDGLVEIAWTVTIPDANGKYGLRYAQLFGTDRLEEAADRAAEVNATPMCNVYVGGALRKPETPLFGRGDDTDIEASLALWCDLDSADSVAQALPNYRDAKPTLLVMTGEVPHRRVQCWWRLSDRIDDPERLRNALMGIAYKMGGDTTVTNPSRVMRLAGSIAWPQKPGRVAELTRIIPLQQPGLAEYMPEHLDGVFPPVVSFAAAKERRHARDGDDGTIVRAQQLGLDTGKVVDGREKYMVKLILATLIEYVGTHGAEPSAEELFDAAWPVYQHNVDFSRPGRGDGEFREKCIYTAQRFSRGQIPRLRGIDEAVEVYRLRSAARAAAPEQQYGGPAIDPSSPKVSSDRFRFELISDLRKLPPTKYLIDGWLPAGSTGILYGKWGAGKSFIAFDQALHLTYGMTDWHGARLPENGADVLVLAREGHTGFVGRIDAFKSKHGLIDDTNRLHFMRASVSFMRDDDFSGLCQAIQAQPAKYQMVLIDTVARVLPGIDMNEQKTVTLFMERCSLISEISGATTVGVHHQNKSGGMMGSVYFEANADFVYEVTRLGEEEGPLREGEIVCTKMKDGEDRWKRQVHFEQVQISVAGSSLAVRSIDDREAKREIWVPPRGTCEALLKAISKAWASSLPLSHMPQTQKTGGYAPRVLGQEFGLSAEVVERLIISWLDNGVLDVVQHNANTKKRGLKVVGDIR